MKRLNPRSILLFSRPLSGNETPRKCCACLKPATIVLHKGRVVAGQAVMDASSRRFVCEACKPQGEVVAAPESGAA
ncbi:MAG TPA: hypothetical protein VMD97_01855 [Candidatus Aquilonibacter sp.]|nr:hypothetical protein [Candidatus Aquilonibacter sp.]